MGNHLELLMSLCRLSYDEFSYAPRVTSREGVWYQLVIGIGVDHVAYLTIDDDALSELCKIDGFDVKSIIDESIGNS